MIEISDFTGLEQQSQATAIRDFVRQEKGWLRDARPGIWEGLHKRKLAIATLNEMALGGAYSLHLLRRDVAVVGIARAVQHLRFKHPGTHAHYEGRYIDYFAQSDLTDEEHDQIARDLARRNDYTGTVLSALHPTEIEHAKGIPRLMTPVGEPAWLEVSKDQDVLKLAPLHDLQLFRTEI